MSPIPLGILAASGASGAAFELIQTSFGNGSSGTIEFSSIPSTYRHLQLRMTVRHDNASSANLEECSIRFNNVSTNIYSMHWLEGSGATVSSGNYSTQNSMWGIWSNAPSSTASVFAGTIFEILDYASTNKFKTVRSLSGSVPATPARISLYSASYQATTAISSIQIFSPNPTTKPFHSSARFSLYGIRG